MTLSPLWIFLDFDGVIMDSMALKLDAYCFALQEYGFPRARIREQQLRFAGLTRALTLPRMFEALAGSPLPEEAGRRALQRFNQEDDRLRSRMQLKSGAREFLLALRNRIPLVVITGTPQAAIDETVAFFQLASFFREVCGYPPVKAEHLRAQLEKRNLAAGQALYVGDAIKDFEAAEASGIPFVGINNGDNPFVGKSLAAEFPGLGELVPALGLR